MLKASQEIGKQQPLPRTRVDMTFTKNKMLDEFVTKSSWRLFRIHGVPDTFFEMDPETYKESEDFKIRHDVIAFLQQLSITLRGRSL